MEETGDESGEGCGEGKRGGVEEDDSAKELVDRHIGRLGGCDAYAAEGRV